MIAIYTTGGTIDNLEYETEEEAPLTQSSIIPELITRCFINAQYYIDQVSFKDGRFVTFEDRKKLAQKCEETSAQKIIITHGTTTMIKTAQFLNQLELSKTIVITGAMVLGGSNTSDALFNLGYAFAQVNNLPNGTYIAMNGQVFSPNNAKKDVMNKRFVTLI